MDTVIAGKTEKDLPLSNIFFFIFFVLSCLNIFLNFLGSSALKWVYLAQIIVVFLSIFFGKKENMIWTFILFSIFEGQGRVIWGYGIFFRLAFDILLGLLVIKELVRSKKILDRKIIPNYLIVAILFHFIWFILELFNPNGPDFIGAIATSKYYVFPFFLFFLLKSYHIDFSKRSTQRKLQDILIILFGVSFLVIYQAEQGEELLYSISNYYQGLFNDYDKFSGENFRPWGTSFLPGGMSTYFYTCIGIILLYRPRDLYPKQLPKLVLVTIFKWVALATVFYCSFISLVRSGTLKLAMITGMFFFFKFIGSRLKARQAIGVVFLTFSLILASPFMGSKFLDDGGDAQNRAFERWEGVIEGGLTSHRAGLDTFINAVEIKLDVPFGYGLGITQSFLPNYQQRRDSHVELPKHYFWHLDNLFLFLIIELGLGAFVYIFIFVAVIVSLLSRLITLLRWQELTSFAVLAISTSSCVTFFIFNWGAVAIPFNPESFYFWFWSSLGFSTFHFTKKKRIESGVM